MSSRDSSTRILDRAIKLVVPVAIEEFAPPPQAVAENLWVVKRLLRFPPLLRLPTHMGLLRLANGGIVVHSPVRLDAALLRATQALGPVVAIVAPNSFHYSYVAEWTRQFPRAALHCAPGLPARVASLPAASELTDDAPPLWAGEIDQVVYGPVGPFSEVVMVHRPSRTLILSDLAFHMTEFESTLQRVAWRMMGVPPHFGPSRSARLTLLRDVAAARPYVRRIAALDFDRIIVAHGTILESDGREEFKRGFAAYL